MVAWWTLASVGTGAAMLTTLAIGIGGTVWMLSTLMLLDWPQGVRSRLVAVAVVVVLQLELAERLHAADPDAALDQLRAARRSVDDARQGTRDLATRFRSVPLGDELANARDLLAAAGLAVELRVAPDADLAPAADLGPVIRETTTNVLRHGGGHRARLVLARDPAGWRYEIANDAIQTPDAPEHGGGSGLDGMRRRVSEAGGTLDVQRGDEFVVVVTVPDVAPAEPAGYSPDFDSPLDGERSGR